MSQTNFPNDPESVAVTLARISRKLDALRLADKAFEIYGADRHRYQLNSPLSEEQLAFFERRARVTVPEEYRAFLLWMGNGGAGPGNGLERLELNWNRDAWPLDTAFPVSSGLTKKALANEPRLRYLEPIDAELHGSLEIADSGCGMFWLLVFSGEQRGTVWFSGSMCELWPCVNAESQQHRFLSWYEEWLDVRLQPEFVGNWRKFIL